MGTMTKLRDNTGIILWILVIAFGGLWVLQDSGVFDTIGAVGQNIATVDGTPISYEEYSQALNQQLDQYQAQTGETAPPQWVDLQREQVFQALVDDRIMQHEMDRLGITVTDDEVYEMILGENPHPIIKAYFSDGQGGVNRALLQSFIDDPEQQASLIALEQYLRAERRRQKLQNLIGATVRVSEQEVLQEYLKRNKTVDTRYVALRYAAVPDDSISISERDLRRFYDAHREEFKRNRTYTIQYVSLPKVPSAADTAAVLDDLERLRDRFAAAEDDSLFLVRNGSERPYTSATFRADELEAPIADAVFANLEPGRIVGPILSGNQYHLIKIQSVEPADEPVVRARHILLRAPEGNEAARAEARARANELRQRILDGESFADLAREFSEDGSAQQGGDLGWFGRGRMVEPFEEATFSARVGEITRPVETRFGIHLIQVTDRTDRAVRLADFALTLRPSVGTLNDAEERLEDLAYFASESEDFQGEAEQAGLTPTVVQVEVDQQFIPGLGNSRRLMNFLADAEPGDISEVIELNDQFIVAHVSAIQPEGYRSFDEVRSEIEPRVRTEKKKEVQRERLARAAAAHDDLDAIGNALNVPPRTANGLRMDNPVVPGLGREPAFVGTAFGLDQGERSGVITGENAAFILEVTNIQEPPPISEAQRQQIRTQLLTQRRNQVQQQWIAGLRERADIEDNRRAFQE
ncbi:MAG: peptidylprolyl isomerase [Bacteroidetes bacterium]|nr:MAG: peptidylprolyl isomerase [Bacteroidota bacterium]